MTPSVLSGSSDPWCCVAASVMGREHLRLGRNNQDAVAVRQRDGLWVAAVADGCGSGSHCEVGARLAVDYLVGSMPAWVDAAGGVEAGLAERAASALVDDLLEPLVSALGGWGERRAEVVHDRFLFGFLCAVVDAERALVFGLGDGVLICDEAVQVLSPGEANAPPYLAYRLLPSGALDSTHDLDVAIHLDAHGGARPRSLVLATDGLAELLPAPGLPTWPAPDDRWAANPSWLLKRLTVLRERERRLADDTSLAWLRRADGKGG